MLTKVFKNGNSQAVRIPAEIAYESMDIALEIVRVGNKITIQPVAQSLGDVLRQMKPLPDFMSEGRGEQAQKDRESF